MEFLLINHPLDCPICDQAGECKLQEQATGYGRGYSRYIEQKNVKPKRTLLGPRVMLDDERCILCSRCVRFCKEIAKDDVLGFTDRGSYSTLTCYPGRRLENDYSLNTVDICPVGALTSKPYRVRGAPVGAQQDQVDRCDGRARLGDPHRHARPRGDAHPAADERRHRRGVDLRQDAPRRRRAADAAARSAVSARERPPASASWSEAFAAIAARVERTKPAASARWSAILPRSRRIFALKDLMTRLNVTNLDCRADGSVLDPQWGRATYRFNATNAELDLADALLIARVKPAAGRRRCSTTASASAGAPPRAFRRHRSHWRESAAHLQLRLSRRQAGDARHYHPAQLWRRHAPCRAPTHPHRRASLCADGRSGRRGAGGQGGNRSWRREGGLERLQRPPRRRLARRRARSRLVPGEGG